jgi:hypothetical protein
MAKTIEELTERAIREGGVLVNLYFDMHGSSKEVIQNSLVEMIGRMTHEPGVIYVTGVVEEPIEVNGMQCTSAEVKLLAKNFNSLVNVSFRYAPIGLDIIKPEEVKLSIREMHDVLLNISQTAQEYTTFITEKVMNEDEKVAFKKQLLNRAEVAKRLLEKGKMVKK